MKLTHSKIRKFAPKPKAYRVTDGRNLTLLIKPNGSKLWQLRYTLYGKDNIFSIGVYPDTSIDEARDHAVEVKRLVKNGIDPNQAKKQDRLGQITFGKVLQSKVDDMIKRSIWTPETHKKRLSVINREILPEIGNTPIDRLTPKHVLSLLRKISNSGRFEVANKAKTLINLTLEYAVANQLIPHNFMPSLNAALDQKKVNHRASTVNPELISGMLLLIEKYDGLPTTKIAIQLLFMWFCRTKELLTLKWSDIDFEKQLITVDEHNMKMGNSLLIPFNDHQKRLLNELKKYSRNQFVFYSPTTASGHLSTNTLGTALKKAGIPTKLMTPHGFRACARTILEEQLNYEYQPIEMQLAHSLRDANGRAYNRTTLLETRRKMINDWCRYLLTLLEHANNSHINKVLSY